MTETHHHLHIPLSIQHAAKMMQDMIALQRGLAKDIKSGEIRLTDEDKLLFDTLASDIDFYLNTIRFLIFSKFTQAIAGYDPRDERIGEPLTEVPDDMTVELITDELDHEPHIHNMKELEAAIKTNHWSDIDSGIVTTEEAYIILHEFNPQTKEYSTSESNQASFDANMQYAFTSLKILHHMLIRARSKYFPQNQKYSSNV